MSVNKLLKRIVAPELSEEELQRLQDKDDMAAAAHLHDYTHGINSDPLLAFAITISALIHDVDHRGVANTRLIEEQPEMAAKYHDKSVAEQNSLDISWAILMEDNFAELRRVLFPTGKFWKEMVSWYCMCSVQGPPTHAVRLDCLFLLAEELLRFRQLLVNVVLATGEWWKTVLLFATAPS
jgi:3'5'-cyclic nucleotide phosphodiesterase